MSIYVFCPFFDWVVLLLSLLSCMSGLYILEIKRLSVTSFARICTHSIVCLFILFMAFFAVKKLVTLIQSSSVQLLSRVQLFVTPWKAACQASLSITNCQSLPKPMFIKSVMPSNHLILCHPLLLLPPIPPSIRVFSNESTFHMRWPKYWSFSFGISPSSEHPGLISLRMGCLDLFAVQGNSQESSPASQFKSINSSSFSFLYSPTLTSIHEH